MLRPPVNQTLVSAVLPVYNEAKVLDELWSRVAESIAAIGCNYEIIFVNDGSTDDSAAILDRLSAEDERVRVVHFSRNFGHQAAVQAGLAHAHGDCVILMDSDLQDSPEAISRFLNEWRDGYDVVYALRSERQEAWWKRCLFDGFHNLLSAISSTPVPAHAGNFSLIDRRVVCEIVSLGERDRYLPGLRAWVGYRQKGIEIRRAARYDEKPRVSLRGLWRLAKTAIFSFSSVPLAMFYVIGYSSLVLFCVLSGYALFCKMFTTLAIPGWTSEMLVASFFGAVNALGISILGEYVTRIYDQVRGRPMYLVARTVNMPGATDREQELLTQMEELLAMAQPHANDVEQSTLDWDGADRREQPTRKREPRGRQQADKRSRKSGRSQAK
jgi:glycosyltransferase involved in cell wall biosynthesis